MYNDEKYKGYLLEFDNEFDTQTKEKLVTGLAILNKKVIFFVTTKTKSESLNILKNKIDNI
ncbi:hypothetical protein HY498_05035 [Candidatus Woesearchaeota archaeon]|nr:hypothetical protein [Candidatus Woesearchaeota archaeon]